MAGDDVEIANDQQRVQSPSIKSNDVSQLVRILKDRDDPLRSYFLGVFLGGGIMPTSGRPWFGLTFESSSSIELYQFLTTYGVTLPKLRIDVDRKNAPSYRAGYAAHVTWRSKNKKLVKVLDKLTSEWTKTAMRPRDKSKRRVSFATFLLGFIWTSGHILFQSTRVPGFCARGVDICGDKEMRRYIERELAKHDCARDVHTTKRHRSSQKCLVINRSQETMQLFEDGLLELDRLHVPLPGKLRLLNVSFDYQIVPPDIMPACMFTRFFQYLGKEGRLHPVFGVIAQDLISLSVYHINIILEAIGQKRIKNTSDIEIVQFVKWTFNHMRKLRGMTPCQDLFALYTDKCLERQWIQEKRPFKDVRGDKIRLGEIYDDKGNLYSKQWNTLEYL